MHLSANKYDGQRSRDPLYLACCRATARAISPIQCGQLVLEVGCGTGMVTEMYYGSHIRLVAVDLSLESLELLRQRFGHSNSNILCVRADATSLPFRHSSFETVICANTIQHLPSKSLREKLVHELARVGGSKSDIVVTAHNHSISKRNRGWKKEGEAGSMSGKVQYIYRFDRDELRSLLADHFRVERLCGAGLPLPYRLKLSPLSRLLESWISRFEFSASWGHMLVAKCRTSDEKSGTQP